MKASALQQLLGVVLTVLLIIGGCLSVPTRLIFEKCDAKGFTCQNSKNITGKVDVIFQCNTTITTQDVLIYLWAFNSPPSITSFTIKDCDRVQLSFSCSGENKPIQWLKVQNVGVLEILPAQPATHNPPEIYFENVKLIENVAKNSFSQIKYEIYKPGCFAPLLDLYKLDFNNVAIGNIETEGFKNLAQMKAFTWNNVTVNRVSVGGVKIHFENLAGAELNNCKFGVLEPLAFQVVADSLSIVGGTFSDIWGSGINATVYDFRFSNASVGSMQSGAIAIQALNVHILDNHFESIESGAFQKISPGLLLDSNRNFGEISFVYKFNNNLIENVEDSGIHPDIAAYKNVASDVTYSSNSLQCSCEGLTWYGADVDLGFGFSVIKDFRNVNSEAKNATACSTTPCMCFGIKPPSKKQFTK